MNCKKMGEKIRYARKRRGYTQKDFADMANISTNYLCEVESGKKMPDMNSLIKIISLLQVHADYILLDELPFLKKDDCTEIIKKLKDLTPVQRKSISDIIDLFLQ